MGYESYRSLSIDFNSTNTHKCQTTHIHSQPKTEDKYKRSHFTLCIMFFCGIIVSNISLINAKLHQFHSEWHWNAICMSITLLLTLQYLDLISKMKHANVYQGFFIINIIYPIMFKTYIKIISFISLMAMFYIHLKVFCVSSYW